MESRRLMAIFERFLRNLVLAICWQSIIWASKISYSTLEFYGLFIVISGN